MKLKHIIYTLSILSTITFSCSSDDDDPTASPADQGAVLENYADNFIIPAYNNFKTDLGEIETILNSYSTENQDEFKTKVESAYLTWQSCAFYNFGPALNQSLENNINIYPVDTNQINTNVEDELTDIVSSNYASQKGLATLDFFANERSSFTTKEVKYLSNVLTDMIDRIEAVENEWSGEADYRGAFIENEGTDQGSSLSLFLNAFIQYFEKDLRDDKLGIPLGVRSSNVQLPEKSEAYYSNTSHLLLQQCVGNMKNTFFGGESEGLDELLLNGEESNELLSTLDELWDNTETAVNTINTPIEDFVLSNEDDGTAVYADIQELLVELKIELTAELDVKISYVDTDGD